MRSKWDQPLKIKETNSIRFNSQLVFLSAVQLQVVNDTIRVEIRRDEKKKYYFFFSIKHEKGTVELSLHRLAPLIENYHNAKSI